MTNTIKTEIKRQAQKAMKENGYNVFQKNIILLECGYGHETFLDCEILKVDYVMFEDKKTGKQYQCYFGQYNEKSNSLWTVKEYIA